MAHIAVIVQVCSMQSLADIPVSLMAVIQHLFNVFTVFLELYQGTLCKDTFHEAFVLIDESLGLLDTVRPHFHTDHVLRCCHQVAHCSPTPLQEFFKCLQHDQML